MKLLEFMGFDTVITVVNLVSKTVHFISTHTIVSIKGAVRLFLHNI